MAQNGESSALTYAGITIIMLVVIAALALFRFNLFDVKSMLVGHADNDKDVVKRGPDDAKTRDDPDTQKTPQDQSEFTAQKPDDVRYRVDYGRELPESLTVTHDVKGHTAEIELRLVPQGYFIMGEDDGVAANMPQKWVWMDAFYMSSTEITNQQYYAFILEDGYRKPKYWSKEGYEYISTGVQTRGSSFIGWADLNRSGRLTALASPVGTYGGDLTLEVLERDLLLGTPGVTTLVLPEDGDWTDYMALDSSSGAVRMNFSGVWQDVTGEDAGKSPRLKDAQYVFTTDEYGRVDLSALEFSEEYAIVAWADGDRSTPIFGRLKRSPALKLRHPDVPVVGVSWFEADACARFYGGDLPTEAQWEKAGRGTDGRTFPWGDEFKNDLPDWITPGGAPRPTSSRANVNRREVMKVGQFKSGVGPYGHLDLVGNASEWCRDVYIERRVIEDANPFVAGSARDRRAQRGSGTEDDDPHVSKLYARRSSDPYKRGVNSRGFRIVYDVDTAFKMAGEE